ncbi:MAG TPA: cytochrome P450 [Acidimicrobiia bacterium]
MVRPPRPSDTFDPYAPSSTDRYDAMAHLRAGGGVAETEAGYYVATADGVEAGLRDVDRFVGSFIDTSGLPEDDIPISAIPEPRHGPIRRVINTVVAGHRTAQAEPFIRDQARRLVASALERQRSEGQVDLVATVVDPLPSTVIAHMFGAPIEDHERLGTWSDELLDAQTGGESRGLYDTHPVFGAYIQGLIEQRRALDEPPDDVITRFMVTEVDGVPLSDRAICTQTMNLIIAGNETTRNLIGNCFLTLATDADLYRRLRADRALAVVIVEESLRHDSPIQVLARAVLADTEIAGVGLRRGDRVVFGVASANRDEDRFAAPADFRTDRPRPREHLAFGTGPHVCPGASLARLETLAAIDAFCDAVVAFHPVDGFVPVPNPVFWALGQRALPVVLSPAPADDAPAAEVE